jgi:hypothetical protein
MGLDISKGKYIARMDGDDISMPDRFTKQVTFLENHPEVILCGSFFTIIGSNDIITVPENHEQIKLWMLKENCFGHPTVMYKKEVLEEFNLRYDPAKEPAEDYDFWVRLMFKGQVYNIQESLLHYRVHDKQVSNKRLEAAQAGAIQIRVNLLNASFGNLHESETETLTKVIRNDNSVDPTVIEGFLQLENRLLESNVFFEQDGFRNYLLGLEYDMVKQYFFKRYRNTPRYFFSYIKVKNKLNVRMPKFSYIKLALKSIFLWKGRTTTSSKFMA